MLAAFGCGVQSIGDLPFAPFLDQARGIGILNDEHWNLGVATRRLGTHTLWSKTTSAPICFRRAWFRGEAVLRKQASISV